MVLEAFGAGNIPNGESLAPILKLAKERGTVVVVCSQCERGNVSIGTYEASRHLGASGAIGGEDMTTEATVAKLYYLFSKYDNPETVKEFMGKNISGGISTRSEL